MTKTDFIREKFTTPFEQHADREGQPFTVVREITEPDDTHDAEVLPMYVIRFRDGFEIEAWPEEVEDQDAIDRYYAENEADYEADL